jgi:hypothetical protein
VQVGTWWLVRTAAAPERVLGAWLALTTGLFVFFHGSLHRSLLEFQPGEAMAALIKAQEPAETSMLIIGETPTHSLPYYAQRDLEVLSAAQVKERLTALGPSAERTVVLSPDIGDDQLTAEGLQVTQSQRFPSFLTSMPSRAFMVASTRPGTLRYWRVVRARVAPP